MPERRGREVCHICRIVDEFRGTSLRSIGGDLKAGYPLATNLEEKYRGEDSDRHRCNGCHGDCCHRRRPPAPAACLSDGASRQDADWQITDRQDPDRQGTGAGRQQVLIRAVGSGLDSLCRIRPLSLTVGAAWGEGMANRLNRWALCLLAGFCASAVALTCEVQSA